MHKNSHFYELDLQEYHCFILCQLCVEFLKKWSQWLPYWLHHFTSPPSLLLGGVSLVVWAPHEGLLTLLLKDTPPLLRIEVPCSCSPHISPDHKGPAVDRGGLITTACMLSHSVVPDFFAPLWTVARQAPLSMGIPKNAGTSCHFPLQEIFLIQGQNWYLLCLLRYWRILY